MRSTGMSDFSDTDAKQTLWRALRMIGIAVLVLAPLIWWRAGWQSALLLVVGAAISGSGLFEWLRLMTAILARMEVVSPAGEDAPRSPRPMARIVFSFVLRMVAALAALYVSLRYLDGSPYALLAGLAMGALALLVESLRLMRSWAS